jgi:hypothetical protein
VIIFQKKIGDGDLIDTVDCIYRKTVLEKYIKQKVYKGIFFLLFWIFFSFSFLFFFSIFFSIMSTSLVLEAVSVTFLYFFYFEINEYPVGHVREKFSLVASDWCLVY